MSDTKPTLDERLHAVIESLESQAHESEAMRARMDRLDARERRARQPLLSGIAAYLQALQEDGE
jgi:hypothetical protein